MYSNKVISHNAFNKTITTDNLIILNEEKNNHIPKCVERQVYYITNCAVNYANTNKPLTQHFDSKLMVKSSTTKVHNDYEDSGNV